MGETISKSAGKVYLGDVVDYRSATDGDWHVAEIIEVNSSQNGLTVLCRDTNEVTFVDFSCPKEKNRVARAGTYSGIVGIERARRQRTRTVATVVRNSSSPSISSSTHQEGKASPPANLSVKQYQVEHPQSLIPPSFSSASSAPVSAPQHQRDNAFGKTSSATRERTNHTMSISPKVSQISKKHDAPGDVTSFAPSLEHRALMRLWKVDSIVDFFALHNLSDPEWKPSKVVSCTPTPGSSSVIVVLHVLGCSSDCDEEVLISPGEMPLRVATFGSKSHVFGKEVGL